MLYCHIYVAAIQEYVYRYPSPRPRCCRSRCADALSPALVCPSSFYLAHAGAVPLHLNFSSVPSYPHVTGFHSVVFPYHPSVAVVPLCAHSHHGDALPQHQLARQVFAWSWLALHSVFISVSLCMLCSIVREHSYVLLSLP